MKRFALKSTFIFSLLIFSFAFSCCSKNNRKIVFDDSEPLSLSPQTQWALVISPYAPVYQETNFQSVVVTYARQGEILQVEGNRTTKYDESTIRWIAVSSGWIVESELEVFSNKLRAETASRKFRSDLDS